MLLKEIVQISCVYSLLMGEHAHVCSTSVYVRLRMSVRARARAYVCLVVWR